MYEDGRHQRMNIMKLVY